MCTSSRFFFATNYWGFLIQGDAHGHLYLDDGVSLDHIKKDYVYMKFDLHEGILKSR